MDASNLDTSSDSRYRGSGMKAKQIAILHRLDLDGVTDPFTRKASVNSKKGKGKILRY